MRRNSWDNDQPFNFNRLTSLSIVIFLFAGLIILRLFYLQIIQHQKYLTLAEGQHVVTKELQPNRGEIYIHDYESGADSLYPVAINKKYYLAYAVPNQITNPQATVKALAPLLALDKTSEEELFNRLSKPEDIYEPVKHKLEEETKQAIEALGLEGIKFEDEVFRYYPEGSALGQVTGFVGHQDDVLIGQYGIEGYWQKELAGEKGSFLFERDASGRLIPLAKRVKADQENGTDIVLTLDRSIQFTACSALKKSVLKHGADSGSVLIMDPKTGAILAMCNYPDFDPNKYNEAADYSLYRNDNISEPYEPGSMIKGLTMAAALDLGAVTPMTTYDDTGSVEIAGYTIKNSDGQAHGLKNMTEVLEESLNTGAIYAARQIGAKMLRNYFERFGFGEKTDIPLSNEAEGNLKALTDKSEIAMATASFGQGFTATPLQIISAFSAIANGGKLMRPYIVEELKQPDGKIEKTQPQFLRQVIQEKTATTLSAMLASVVKAGHAKRAAIPGYYIAGKTGTAQVADPETKKYSPDKTIHSFIGFAPIENPRFVMLTKLDHPRSVRFAESSAVPLFSEIAQFLLNYLKVPPTFQP